MAIYLALNAALLRARDRLLYLVDRADAFPHLLRVIFWALLAVATAAALLDHGAWTRKESFPGPFRLSDQWPGRYAVNIGAGVPFWLGLRLIQAVPGPESTLMGPRLLLAGRDIGLPQMPQPEIAQEAARWLGARERELSFALPDGVSNDSGLLLSVSYVVRFHSTFYDVARWGFGLIVLLRLVLARRWIGRSPQPRRWCNLGTALPICAVPPRLFSTRKRGRYRGLCGLRNNHRVWHLRGVRLAHDRRV